MRIDLFHNQIIARTATELFADSVKDNLLPLVTEIYGDGIDGILMYEDFLNEDFLIDGEWYYPLTVLTADAAETCWVKWNVADKKSFKGGVPYAYIGEDKLEFTVVDEVPEELVWALNGHAINYDTNAIKIKVHSTAPDPLFLVGKYSQTFVDELARQITAEIARTMSVAGLEDSTMQLELVFAPETYMEHTSENVTYRRLLLTDKGCQARDFWVRWTRLDGVVGYSVDDLVNCEVIKFEIGEDVPQKIREKEYRFLCRANPDKYQSAMGKKTATEWRDLIKRAVRRNEIVRVELPVLEVKEDTEVTDKLKELLGEDYVPATADEPVDDGYGDIEALARAALGQTEEPEDEEETVESDGSDDEFIFGLDIDGFDDTEAPIEEDETEDTDTTEAEEALEISDDAADADGIESEIDEPDEESAPESEDDTKDRDYAEIERLREERIRAEVEARVRLEYEAEARARAEAEAERLRLEHERLKAENARLLEEARLAEEKRAREEAERKAEEEKRAEEERLRREEEERVRARIAEQARLEAEERARLAEAARIALEEQKRAERERAERAERERELAELREKERLEREQEERRREAMRLAEERRRMEAARRPRPVVEPVAPTVNYVTKHAKLIFRRMVDLNVIKRIKEIIENTLIATHKEHIHIHIKAYPLDSYTINLDIMKIPDTEGDLLVAIIKAIGNGNLGISKIIVE